MSKKNVTDSKKLTAFIIGMTAHLARLEKALQLPALDANEYRAFARKGGVYGGSLSDDVVEIGEEIASYNGEGFFDWINDNIISPVVKPVVDVVKEAVPFVKPILSNPLTKTAIGMAPGGHIINGVLGTVGLGNQVGGDYIIRNGSQYVIEKNNGGQYVIEKNNGGTVAMNERVQESNQRIVNGQIYAPDRTFIHDKYKYKPGAIYRIRGKLFMYTTDQGFVAPPTTSKPGIQSTNVGGCKNVRGSAYLDEDGKVVVASHAKNNGLLGNSAPIGTTGSSSSSSRSSRSMVPSDFTQ